MAARLIGCIFLLCVAGTLAGPISWEESSSTCATECPESSKFAYQPDTQYEYQYETDIQTSIPGSTEEQSSLHMRATVQIEVLAPCEMNLKLTDVSLQDSNPLQYETRQHVDEAWEFKRLLQEKGLRFGFQDGRIEHICPDEEPVWVLNIKRGVLSGFQNTQSTLDSATKGRETDISGECPVEYSITGKSWSVKKVKKVKDMLGCTERHGHDSAFAGTPYEIDSSIKSLPLMKTSYECDQEINGDGLLIQSICKEYHIFRPFSDGQGGAQTMVDFKLTFTKQSRGVQTTNARVSRRSTLLYDHTLSAEEVDAKLQTAQQLMRKICKETRDDIRPEVPEMFAELIREMRTLDSDSLSRLHENAATMCDTAVEFFRDAVPNLGTASSLTLIRVLLEQGKVEETEAGIWLTHLAFVPQPSLAMLRAVKPLLTSSGEILRKAALAISSMVHNYCRMNAECNRELEVRDIVKVFENNLNYNCKARDPEQHQTIMMSLKALGNTGNSEVAAQTLARCFQSEEETTETRVAAIQAFRRMPCSADRSGLMSMFSNKEEDSELRINAYLMLMQCVNEDLINQIQEELNQEEVNQVGSFVWTHLTNLMESSDPNHIELRELLEKLDLKAFDLDMRKFSRNVEMSLFSEMINTGAKAESNLIFSHQSFVPRSGMVNLTLDMFGHSINLFEVGGRVEGLESLLEQAFGPESNSVHENRDVIRPSLLQRLDSMFSVPESKGPQGSYYLKIFGNEIHYNDFHDLDFGSMKEQYNYLDWLIKLSQEQQFDYTKSFLFLDSAITVPTAVGLPLKLSVDGSATVNVRMNGKMDVRQLMSAESTVDINGAIQPSAAVELCSEMSVNAFVAKAGLKMTTTMHSSTVTQGKISLLKGRVFHFDLEMPREKQEIFSTESKFYVMYRAENREQRMIGQGRTVESDCYDLTSALGVELCGEMSVPVLSKDNVGKFPFTGPASMSVYINKKDTFTKYHVEGSYDVDKKTDATEFKLNINTPGSKIDREIDIFFNLNPAQRTVSLNAKTPWKKAVMSAEITNTETLKRASAKALIDDRDEYNFVTQVQIDAKKFGTSYVPKVELVVPGKPTRSLSGNIFYRDNKKFEIDLTLDNVFKAPVKCDGAIMKVDNAKRMKYDMSLNINSDTFKGKIDGFLDNLDDSISSRVVFAYKNGGSKQERVVFSNKIRDQSTKTLTSWSLDTALTTTFLPKYNGDISMDYTYGRNTFTANLDAGFDERRRIKFSNSANFDANKKEINLNGKAKLEIPAKDMDYEVSVSHLHDMKVVQSKAALKYHGKSAEATIDARRDSTNPVKAYAQATLTYPGRTMSVRHEIEEKKPKEFHNVFEAQLDKYSKVTAVAVYKMKPRHEIDATINIPNVSPITIEGYFNPDLYDMQAHAAVKYENRKYFSTVAWTGPKSFARDFDADGSLSFGCPYQTMKWTSKMSWRRPQITMEHELLWDLERSPEKKASATLTATLIPSRPNMNVRVAWYPNQFVQVEADGKYETEGWYRTTNDLEGSIKFTSSFPYLQNINAKVKHDYGHDNIASNALVSWGPGQKIDADFVFNKNTWQQIDSSLTVNTPFPGFQSMKLAGNHKLQQGSLDSMVSFEWDRKQIKLAAEGTADLRRKFLDGQASFTSPLPGYETISINAKHQDNGRNFNSDMSFSWAPNKKVTAKFTMAHQRNGFSINNNGELLITTPVQRYRQNKMTWNHMNKDGSLSTRLDSDNDGVKSTVSIDGSIDTNPRKTVLSGNFMIETPFMTDVRVKINHLHNKKGIQSNGLVTWSQNQVIEYIHDIKFEAWELLEVAAKLTTPYKKYNKVTLESKSGKSGLQLTTENEFKWGPNEKVNIDGTLSLHGGKEFTGQLRVTTPLQYFERTVLSASNGFKNDVWDSHMDLDYASKSYEVDTQFGMNSRKKLMIDLTKLFEYGFRAEAEFSGDAEDFTTLANMRIPSLNESPMGAELKVNYASLRNVQSSFILTTPWSQARTVKATVGHKQQGRASFTTDATFEMPAYKGAASHTMNLNGWTDFDTKSFVKYQNKVIELITMLQGDPKIEGRVTFTSPFTQPITFIVNHEGDASQFKTGAELSYKNAEKISADVDYMLQGTTMKANARILSPYYERIHAAVNHNGGWKNFENDASVEMFGKRVAAESKFNLAGSKMQTSVGFELPLRRVRSIKAQYSHDGPLNNFKCDSSLTVDGKTGTGKLEFKNAKVMSGSAELTTPFPEVRLLKGEFNHDAKKWNSFENDGKLTWNNKEYTADSELRWYGTVLRVIANVKAPTQEYALKIKHKGAWDDFTNSADIDLSSGSKYSAESAFKAQGQKVEGSFGIVTPHQTFDKMSGDFSYTGNRKGFVGNANLKTPFNGYERFSGEINHSGSMNDFTTSTKINTPFRKLPSATFTVAHAGDRNNFECQATAEYGRKSITGKVNFNNAGRKTDGSVSLDTPYSGYERFEGSFSHAGVPRNFKSNAEIKTPFADHNRYAVNLEHTGASLENFKTSGEVNTPFTGYERSAFSINHNGDISGMTTDASVETSLPGYDKFGFKINHNGDPKNVQSMVQLTTPITGYETFGIKVNHEGDTERFESGAEIQTPWRNYNVGGSVRHSGTWENFDSGATIKLPIRNYQDWAISVTHNGDVSAFTSSATLSMPFNKLPELKMTVNHRGSLSDFDSGITTEYNGKKLTSQATWTYENTYYTKSYGGSLKLSSPYQYLRNLEITGNHKRESETKTGMLLVKHNDQQKVNLDYTYTTGANKNIRVTFTEPKIFEVLLNFNGNGPSFTSDLSFSWERKTNVEIELNLKNEVKGTTTERQITFKTILPRREVGFDVVYTTSPEALSQRTEIHWDRDAASKLSYDLQLSHTTYRKNVMDGSFKVDSQLLNFETTFSHSQTTNQAITEASITMDETLTIKREATVHDRGMTLVFTSSHPRFSRDAILRIDATRDSKVLEGEVDLQFERESINFKGKIADEIMDGSKDMKYVATSQLSWPNMRLDMKFDGAIYNNRVGCGGNMEFNHLTSRDGMRTMTSTLTYDKEARTSTFEMTSPITTVKITGSEAYHDNYNGIHKFIITAEMDNTAVRTEFGIDVSGRKIEAKFFTPEDDMLHAYIRYMRPSAEFKVYRQQAGAEINDIVLNLDLDSDKLVTGAAYVRPQIWSDLKAMYTNTDLHLRLADKFEPVKRALIKEMESKQQSWERVSERPRAAYSAVMEDMSNIATKVSRAFAKAYRANEFHMRTIGEAMNDLMLHMERTASIYIRHISRAAYPYMESMQQWRKSAGVKMVEWKSCVAERAEQAKEMLYGLSDKVRSLYAKYRPYITITINKVRAAYKKVKDTVMDAYSTVRDHPQVKETLKAIKSFQPSDMFAPLKKLKYRMSVQISKLREEYSTAFDALEDFWNNIAMRSEIRDMAMFLRAIAEKGQKFWNKYDIQKNIRIWLNNLSKANWRNLKNQATNGAKEYLQIDRTRWTEYDPRNGNFQFELYVPYDLKELQKLPKLDLDYYMRKAQNIMDDLTIDEDWSVWDTIYRYMPSMDYTNWIPPFKSYATIAGRQHFITFDKKYYEFAGECSYLLARDFVSGRFSVVVNYQSQSGEVSKKSITVFSNERQVEVFPDGHIMLDGRPAEMPMEIEGTTIKRNGNMVYIDNNKGVKIDCDLPHDRCTVAVSGWYFGKTAGLLGTYDNEPVTDLMRSDNKLADTIEELAESWTVGSRCRSTNYAYDIYPEPDTRRYELCAEYFKDTTSPFRPCFKQVDPADFMTMCLNEKPTNINRLETEEVICNSASYYVNQCKRSNVNIRMPRTCVRCDLPDGNQFIEGENITLTNKDVPKSADVVFVVQHGACNKDVITKMPDILNYFQRTFQEEGMDDIQYGVVGFGGPGVHGEPESHTTEGHLMSRAEKVIATINALEFNGEDEADVMSAVRFASLYSFRTGVSKSIIVLPCDTCRDGATRYTELQRILIERDIRLHMLMDHTFQLRGTKSVNPKSGLMFGMDKDGLFIDKHVTDNALTGDAELRKQVTKPKDLCAALSDVTDGSVFSSSMMTSQRSSTQKAFIDVMVRLMVKKAEPSDCQMCECVSDNVKVGTTVCHHCEMNPIYNIMPEFEEEYDYEDESIESEEEEESVEDIAVEEPKRPIRRYGKNKDKTGRRNRKGRQQ